MCVVSQPSSALIVTNESNRDTGNFKKLQTIVRVTAWCWVLLEKLIVPRVIMLRSIWYYLVLLDFLCRLNVFESQRVGNLFCCRHVVISDRTQPTSLGPLIKLAVTCTRGFQVRAVSELLSFVTVVQNFCPRLFSAVVLPLVTTKRKWN